MRKTTILIAALACMSVSCQESLEERCEREAREYTSKKCPAPIGEGMTIDSMTFDRATHTLHYYYTLSGNMDNADIVNDANVYGVLLEQVKNATSVKDYKDAGYSFAYTYHSAKDKGKVICEVKYGPKDYR